FLGLGFVPQAADEDDRADLET
ncbi:MAG: hypothetical protein RLZZ435_202, partial [Cyanobacteriota bacterium]